MVSFSLQALYIPFFLSATVFADPLVTARDPGQTIDASGAHIGNTFIPKGSTGLATDGTLVFSVGTNGAASVVHGATATAATSASVSEITSLDASDVTGNAITSNGVAVSVGSGGVSIGTALTTTSSGGDSAESTNGAGTAAMVGSFGALGGGLAAMAALL